MKSKSLLAFFFSSILVLTIACNQSIPEVAKINWKTFGDKISDSGAVAIATLESQLSGKDSIHIKVAGKVDEVCQKKGCWMTIPVGEKSMRVRFKDYGFFMPKDCSGKDVIFEGKAFYDTTTVEMLKHYAHDAGKPEAEIAKITEPEIDLSFEASGVLLNDEPKNDK